MKIGQLIKEYVKKIFYYCETVDHDELMKLMDAAYSKKTFDINFPFCAETSKIPPELSKRYWTTTYIVRGKNVRVTSQWFDSHISNSRSYFSQYLLPRMIATKEEIESTANIDQKTDILAKKLSRSPRSNSRYKGNAIGNAQNLVIRNILSNLGQESFGENDWKATKEYFVNSCAYCGETGELQIDHAVPINRKSIGEHRLGNLVPSCKKCNASKADKDFREFLGEDSERINIIEQYMDSRNYVPLGDNEQVQMILKIAYQEVSSIPKRYIAILNEILPSN